MKLLLMSDGPVGFGMVEWIVQNYPQDVAVIVTVAENDISALAKKHKIIYKIYESSEQLTSFLSRSNLSFDLGLLAWWPRIIKEPLISLPAKGFVNTHPSLLPYNRGKHYNFWTLVEQSPFGVTLHEVDAGVDSGAIIAQEKIDYGWEDNGETMYNKATVGMLELIKKIYPKLRELNFSKTKQNDKIGSFHLASELDGACKIDLDKEYSARELLNLLRARTFTGYPGCWFVDGDDKYEVRINIKKVAK